MSWQPIETAPTDGTRVLLGWAKGRAVTVGRYGPKFSTHGINYGNEWGFGERWNEAFEVRPSHWMPLPDPPRE